tara:strand:+ start:327 stop:857 length:531 start_codon:yes stop_codon:yes gene_type:complete
MTKVILIGASKSLLNDKLGKIIDSYDIVCRMNNNGRPELLNGEYKDILGTKRNIWLCKSIGLLKVRNHGYDEVVGFPIESNFVKKVTLKLKEFNEFNKKPSCGILSIMYLLEKYNKVHICGIDGFKGGHWYGNKFIKQQNESDKNAANGFGAHNAIKEQEYINHLIQNGKIKKIDE